MSLYEVHLVRNDDDEIRLTDHALHVGETVSIGEQTWRVQQEAPPERADAVTRYICIRVDAAE
jgi:hypothetical protein